MLASVLQSSITLFRAFPLWTITLALVIAAVTARWIRGRRRNYPTGPVGLPLVGYLPFLGDNMHLQLDNLRKKYGDIYSLRLGVRDVVVLCNFKLTKEAYSKDEVSDRPSHLLKWNETEGIKNMMMMKTKEWKESRKFTLNTLRTLGMGKNKVEENIMDEIQSLVESLAKCVGQPKVNIPEAVCPAVNRLIISMICGTTLSDDEEFSKTVDTFSKNVLDYLNATSIGYYLPFINPILPIIKPQLKKLTANIKKMEKFMFEEIAKHNEENDQKMSRDNFMDHFVAEMKKAPAGNTTLNDGYLNGNSQALIVGANDTTVTSIEWFMLLMAEHQEVQERAYQEIVRVVGKERQPTWSDKDDLPYVNAAINEAWRFKTLAPAGGIHIVSKDTTIGGFDIPSGTTIITNLHSIHMHPDLWEDPEQFNPNRFLTPDGKKAKDPECLIPFSIGKRFCVGEKLARMELFLFKTAILQSFKILPPAGGVNMNSTQNLALHPTHPFVKLEDRN